MPSLAVLILPLAAVALPVRDSTPHRVRVSPARPKPGAIVQITVRPDSATRGEVVAVQGTLAGEPLHFERRADGSWIGVGGVPTSATDSLALPVVVVRGAARDSSITWLRVPPAPPSRGEERLRVDGRFGRAPDSALAARMEREAARALAVGRAAHETPRLWRAPFARPRTSRVTSGFGSGRTFNGAVQSQHGGVDYAGATGAPVRAANRGVVALVDTFYLAGRAVYVDHGAGIVTGYFHLSAATVAPGDTVERGQVIGRVGATGRVTGPHLHWMARYGTVTVDPAGLLRLWVPAVETGEAGGAPRSKKPKRASRGADRENGGSAKSG